MPKTTARQLTRRRSVESDHAIASRASSPNTLCSFSMAILESRIGIPVSSLTPAHGPGRYRMSSPAMVAVWKQASEPATMARRPSCARSDLRSGASAPMPPIWIAIEEKLEKPHRA